MPSSLAFEEQFGPISASDITDFERLIRAELPNAYKEFLLETNGGRPIPADFLIPGTETSSTVSVLLGIDKTSSRNDLVHVFQNQELEIGDDNIEIGNDLGGNLLLLVFRGKKTGAVLYVDILWELPESVESTFNSYVLSNSFDEFLDSLFEFQFPQGQDK